MSPLLNLRSIVFFAGLVGVAVYSYFSVNQKYDWVVPAVSKRSPAAVRTPGFMDEYKQKPLRLLKKEIALSSIIFKKKKKLTHMVMQQFAVESGVKKNWLCLEYSSVRLKFASVEVGSTGESTVWVEAPCQFNHRAPAQMSQIPLPFGELEKIFDGESVKTWSHLSMNGRYIAEHSQDTWPKKWRLIQIEFYSSDQQPVKKFDSLKDVSGEDYFVYN